MNQRQANDLFDYEVSRAVNIIKDVSLDEAEPWTPDLEWRDMGRTAGTCYGRCKIALNPQLLALGEAQLLETMRHELAHWLVNEYRYRLGVTSRRGKWSSHGNWWKYMADRMGCTGSRCHSLALAATRKVKRHTYRLPSGTKVELTTIRHNKLQRGQVQAYRYKPTGERIVPEYHVTD